MAAGRLYLLATPIGNLEDLSARAERVLREVMVIACEDTRQTAKLLARFGIATPTVSYHQHNEKQRAAALVARLSAGDSVALVSDAGMPLISDPGQYLVAAALAQGIQVIPIPGPCAVVTALAASGFAAAPFYFAGFLPATAAARRRELQAWRSRPETIVFYEAPHRIAATMADAAEILGRERRVALARELTKVHEEFLRGTIGEVSERLQAAPARGEFTVVLAPAEIGAATLSAGPSEVVARLRQLLAGGAELREALKQVARETGQAKAKVYRQWQIARAAGPPPAPGESA